MTKRACKGRPKGSKRCCMHDCQNFVCMKSDSFCEKHYLNNRYYDMSKMFPKPSIYKEYSFYI